MIIAAYAGTGKTTLAMKHPHAFTDFVCMPYKYHLDENNRTDDEACKANPDNIMRDEWPYNYVSAIKSAYEYGKHLLIPTDMQVLMLLERNNLPYFLCYPVRNAKEAYRQRFINRGNTAEFIDIFINRWDWFLDRFEQDTYGQPIVMKPDEFLSDVILCEDTHYIISNKTSSSQ